MLSQLAVGEIQFQQVVNSATKKCDTDTHFIIGYHGRIRILWLLFLYKRTANLYEKTLLKTNDENQATKHVIYQNMGVINKGGLDDGT